MIFTVLWKPAAERRLATLWVNAPDRIAVTVAANRIDELLRTDPVRRGESRPDRRRILLVPPLGVLFTIHPDDRVVWVVAVWRFEKGPQTS